MTSNTPPTNIMLVDDEPDLLDTLHDAIEQWGYHAKSYSNQQKALQEIKNCPEKYQVAVVDLPIYKKGAIEQAKEILENSNQMKVILMTADDISNELRDELKTSFSKVHEILRKPFTLDQLHSLL